MKKICLIGGSGLLGKYYAKKLSIDNEVHVADIGLKNQKKSKNLFKYYLDLNSEEKIDNFFSKNKKKPFDVLINNAAIHGPHDQRSSFGNIDILEWSSVIMTNTIAPLKVTEAFFDNVKKSIQKKIVFISSRSGSITERGTLPHHKPGGPYIYRSSKAALNAITQSLSFDLTRQGFSVIVLHPGFVKTEMAIGDTELDVSTSVAGMKKIITESTPNDNGLFRTFEGKKIFW